MLRYARCVASRRVHDQNAAACGCIQIDIVYAHARASDDAQLAGVIQQLVGHARGAAHDERIGVGQSRLRAKPRPAAPPASLGSASNLTPCSLMRSGNNNFHGVMSLSAMPSSVKLMLL